MFFIQTLHSVYAKIDWCIQLYFWLVWWPFTSFCSFQGSVKNSPLHHRFWGSIYYSCVIVVKLWVLPWNLWAISSTARFSLTLPSRQLSIWTNCRAEAWRSCLNITLLWHWRGNSYQPETISFHQPVIFTQEQTWALTCSPVATPIPSGAKAWNNNVKQLLSGFTERAYLAQAKGSSRQRDTNDNKEMQNNYNEAKWPQKRQKAKWAHRDANSYKEMQT